MGDSVSSRTTFRVRREKLWVAEMVVGIVPSSDRKAPSECPRNPSMAQHESWSLTTAMAAWRRGQRGRNYIHMSPFLRRGTVGLCWSVYFPWFMFLGLDGMVAFEDLQAWLLGTSCNHSLSRGQMEWPGKASSVEVLGGPLRLAESQTFRCVSIASHAARKISVQNCKGIFQV